MSFGNRWNYEHEPPSRVARGFLKVRVQDYFVPSKPQLQTATCEVNYEHQEKFTFTFTPSFFAQRHDCARGNGIGARFVGEG